MASVTIHAVLNAESLELPELRGLLGKSVTLRVTEESGSAIDRMLDTECHAECEAEFASDPTPAKVRAALSRVPINMAADVIAEREER